MQLIFFFSIYKMGKWTTKLHRIGLILVNSSLVKEYGTHGAAYYQLVNEEVK
jgi:hypothetical protein